MITFNMPSAMEEWCERSGNFTLSGEWSPCMILTCSHVNECNCKHLDSPSREHTEIPLIITLISTQILRQTDYINNIRKKQAN